MEDNEPQKKRKSGLHKAISSIFEGVPIPGKDSAQQPSGAATPGRAEQGPAREPRPPVIKPRPAKQLMPKVTTSKSRLQEIWQKIKTKLLQPQEGVSSSRQKIMLALIPVLIIIVLIFVFMPLLKTPWRKMPEFKGVEPTEIAAEPGRRIDWKIPEPYPSGLRDPMQMRPSTTGKPEGEKVSERMARLPVKGIVYSMDNPAAVVGTQLVHEGDIVLDVTIVKINQDSVEFKMNSKSWTQRVE